MLLRICLIVAILGGAGVVAVNFFMVKPAIEQLAQNRDDWKTKDDNEVIAHNATKKTLKDTQAKLDITTKNLAQTKSQLETANAKIEEDGKQITDLTGRLTDAENKRDAFQAALSKFEQLHVTPDDIIQLQKDVKKLNTAIAGVQAENKLLVAEVKDKQEQLDLIHGTNAVNPSEPAGLKGKIIAVDPKYDFVVLDIGRDKNVVNRGVMMVAREGKLLGKVRISRVDRTESIATLMPDWNLGQVMEGDEVLY